MTVSASKPDPKIGPKNWPKHLKKLAKIVEKAGLAFWIYSPQPRQFWGHHFQNARAKTARARARARHHSRISLKMIFFLIFTPSKLRVLTFTIWNKLYAFLLIDSLRFKFKSIFQFLLTGRIVRVHVGLNLGCFYAVFSVFFFAFFFLRIFFYWCVVWSRFFYWRKELG